MSLRFNFPEKFHLLKFGCASMTLLRVDCALRPSTVGMDAFPNLEFAVKCVCTGSIDTSPSLNEDFGLKCSEPSHCEAVT